MFHMNRPGQTAAGGAQRTLGAFRPAGVVQFMRGRQRLRS
jgi:hypothetical protein